MAAAHACPLVNRIDGATTAVPLLAPTRFGHMSAAMPLLPLRVLVVEDHEDCLATMVEFVRVCGGCEVRAARDAIDAVTLPEEWRPIFLDLGLPVVDGYEAAKRIRALQSDPRPLIVAVTGWSTAAAQEHATQCDIDAFMVKPVPWEQLANVLGLRGTSIDSS